MKRHLIAVAMILLITSLGGVGSVTAADKTISNARLPKIEAYRIQPGDVLEITTWKEPDLTRPQVLVRTDGKISFPLLNDVQASGLTPLSIKKSLEAGLKDYVENPFVTVTVRDPASQKFYILGEVSRTGEYPLTKSLTVLQAFALAGGFTEWASKKEILLLRNENGSDKIFRINYKDITDGKDFSQNISIKADDTIIVP
ncbi:MAG: polysaccharide biosynthesis/export family protein [Desulfobacterales bacterium]